MGKKESALSLYKEAALIQPEDPTAQSDLALCHLSMGQYAKALASFKNAAKLDEANTQHGYNVAKCHSKMGNLRAGFNEYRKHCNPLSSVLYTAHNAPIRVLPLPFGYGLSFAIIKLIDFILTTCPKAQEFFSENRTFQYTTVLTALTPLLLGIGIISYDTCKYSGSKITHLAKEGKESFVSKYERATGKDKESLLPTRG